MSSSYNYILDEDLDKTPLRGGSTAGEPVHLFAEASTDAMIASTAALRDNATSDSSPLRGKLHSPDIPCSEELDYVADLLTTIYQRLKTLPHPHHLATADYVLQTLRDLPNSGFYARDTPAITAVDRPLSSPRASPLCFLSSEVAAAESAAEDVVKISTDNNTTAEEVSVRDLDLYSYTRKEVCLTIVQVDDVEVLLCTASQTHKDRLKKSLKIKRYQHGVVLMTLASLASGKLSSVKVDSKLRRSG